MVFCDSEDRCLAPSLALWLPHNESPLQLVFERNGAEVTSAKVYWDGSKRRQIHVDLPDNLLGLQFRF